MTCDELCGEGAEKGRRGVHRVREAGGASRLIGVSSPIARSVKSAEARAGRARRRLIGLNWVGVHSKGNIHRHQRTTTTESRPRMRSSIRNGVHVHVHIHRGLTRDEAQAWA